jgi:hypothetical protein
MKSPKLGANKGKIDGRVDRWVGWEDRGRVAMPSQRSVNTPSPWAALLTSWDAPSQEGRPEARRASNVEKSKVGLETGMVMTNENSPNCGGKRETEDNRDCSQSVWVSGCR